MPLSLEDLGFVSPANKVVLISGATGGIGRSTATLVAAAGGRIVAMGRRRERLDSLKSEIAAAGGLAPLLVEADVCDEMACASCVERAVEAFGRLDVLVNNAAVGFPVEIASCSTEDYRRTMQTNVDGVFFLTRAALGPMRTQKSGHVVMISSDAGALGNPVAPIYGASKHALEGFTSSLRLQLDKWHAEGVHIRVSNVWPGSVDSEYWGERIMPRERFMTCDEMAAFILQVICTRPTVNVTDLRVQQFRFPANTPVEPAR